MNDTTASVFKRLRIIELGTWLAAPSASALFADLGAEVIKVEAAGGDPLRRFPASMRGGDAKSPGFALLNRNKKSVVLDITQPEGREKLDVLLASADVLVTNMRNASLDKLKLDPDSVTRRFPALIYASLTGLGLAGPDKDLPGFDSGAFWARSGLLNQILPEGSEPAGVLGGYGDLMTSLSLFSAVLVALMERESTGRGGLVETSLLQTAAWVLSGDVAAHAATGKTTKMRSRAKSRSPLVNSYCAADGRWFFLSAVESERHFAGICRAIGRSDLVDDERFSTSAAMSKNAAELIAIFDEAFRQRPLDEWRACFDKEGVPCEKVATPGELMQDPQIDANAMARELAWGDSTLKVVTSPFRVFERKAESVLVAPDLGEHGAELLNGNVAARKP